MSETISEDEAARILGADKVTSCVELPLDPVSLSAECIRHPRTCPRCGGFKTEIDEATGAEVQCPECNGAGVIWVPTMGIPQQWSENDGE